jgi:hypothetical protein
MSLDQNAKIFFKNIFDNYKDLESNKEKIREWYNNIMKNENLNQQLLHHLITKVIRLLYQENLIVN